MPASVGHGLGKPMWVVGMGGHGHGYGYDF
jgi:hypothetical protein